MILGLNPVDSMDEGGGTFARRIANHQPKMDNLPKDIFGRRIVSVSSWLYTFTTHPHSVPMNAGMTHN